MILQHPFQTSARAGWSGPHIPIYHLDKPKNQPWPEIIQVLANVLGVLRKSKRAFERFVRRVRETLLFIDMDSFARGQTVSWTTNFLRM
ncbi:hypothetical protein BDV11DRAFT_200495 [Aspergillus similis]